MLNIDEELSFCKHCGRAVILGPPCCYGMLNDLYQAAQKEIKWLRKIQSKQTKRINNIKEDLFVLNFIYILGSIIIILSCLFFWIIKHT